MPFAHYPLPCPPPCKPKRILRAEFPDYRSQEYPLNCGRTGPVHICPSACCLVCHEMLRAPAPPRPSRSLRPTPALAACLLPRKLQTLWSRRRAAVWDGWRPDSQPTSQPGVSAWPGYLGRPACSQVARNRRMSWEPGCTSSPRPSVRFPFAQG